MVKLENCKKKNVFNEWVDFQSRGKDSNYCKIFSLFLADGGTGEGGPMRGLELIMWHEGQWEASKKLAQRRRTTDPQTNMATLWLNRPSGGRFHQSFQIQPNPENKSLEQSQKIFKNPFFPKIWIFRKFLCFAEKNFLLVLPIDEISPEFSSPARFRIPGGGGHCRMVFNYFATHYIEGNNRIIKDLILFSS